jgi:hypothetical protein
LARVIRFPVDLRFLAEELPIRIQRLDLASGTLTRWKEVPTDVAVSLGRTMVRRGTLRDPSGVGAGGDR